MKSKEKICANPECGNTFLPYNSLQKYCSYECHNKCHKTKPKKKRKPINKIGKKHAKLLTQYSKIRKEFLSHPENQYCPVTGTKAIEIHHMMGKIGYADDWARQFNVPLLIDERHFLAVSRAGHQRIELNPEWAKEKGFSESRLEIIKK